MARSPKYEIGVGLLLLGALLVLAIMALQVGALSQFGSRLHLVARFDDVAGLQHGAQVAVAGVEVGTVADLAVEGRRAVVRLAVDPEVGLHQGTTARIRARSVLGEKYVELTPGPKEAPPLRDGAVIPTAGEQVEIDELVALIGPLVEAIDPDALAQTMETVNRAFQEDPERVGRMLENVDRILQNAAEASEDLPELVAEGRSVAARAEDTLASVDARAREAESVIAQADRALGELNEDLPEITDETRALVADARRVMVDVEASMEDLEAVLGNLKEIDRFELRRLLREEGILVRFRPREVVEEDVPFNRLGTVKEAAERE